MPTTLGNVIYLHKPLIKEMENLELISLIAEQVMDDFAVEHIGFSLVDMDDMIAKYYYITQGYVVGVLTLEEVHDRVSTIKGRDFSNIILGFIPV